MRRSFALALAALLCLSLAVAPAHRALAQEPPVRLTLVEQSPDWNDRTHPTVTIRVRVENTGDETYDDLSVGVTLSLPARSRTAFEASLIADPPDSSVLLGETRPREGTLAPGDVREFEVPVDLPVGQMDATQSFVYPLKVDIRSRLQPLAAVRTGVVYLVRQPLFPLAFSWTFVLHAELVVQPDGTFAAPTLQTAVSPGGRLAGELSALSHLVRTHVPVDLVVSPLLLYQLGLMRDGYRVVEDGRARTVQAGDAGASTAAAALARLRTIAGSPNVELSTLPYAEPLLPALTSGGLARDLGVQIQRGRDLVASMLGRTPSTSVFRPPGSRLDEVSIDDLPGSGISTLLLDPTAVESSDDAQGFAASPLVSLAAQTATLTGVVGDAAVHALLASGIVQDDPVLAAHALLGDLAEIWLQQPGERRALAVTFGEGFAAPGSFYGALVRGVGSAPWLAKTRASDLTKNEDLPRPAGVSQLIASPSSFSTSYVDEIKQARRRIESLRTMLVRPSQEPDHLDLLLLLAESQRFVGDERAGAAFIEHVDGAVASVFGSVRPQVGPPITLTSSAVRNVPIAVRNVAHVPLRVTIRLTGQHLTTPVQRTRTLPARSLQMIDVDLDLKTTGRFTVRVQVLTPSGRVIHGEDLIVRSTAYNRVALLITIGAAVLAMLVWARRFLPRRTA